MTAPDDQPAPEAVTAVARSLRDLIPDYHGPADPLLRVGASIRRRRARRRALLAVGAAAGAAALVAVVPALVLPTGTGGLGPAGPGAATGPAPLPSAPAALPTPPVVYPVEHGTVAGARWAVGSTSPGGSARRCFYSDDDLFTRDTVCFDGWKAGAPVSWAVQPVAPACRARVTRVVGVAPAGTVRVLVRLADGRGPRALAVRTPTDPAARFFALVLPGSQAVRSVAPLDAAGRPLGPAATDPGAPPCRPGPDDACAQPPK